MKLISFISSLSLLLTCSLAAAPTDGKYAQRDEKAKISVQEHYATLMRAFENKEWQELIDQSSLLMKSFPSSPFAQEALFYTGVGHFHLKDYEMANMQFSQYLKKQATPKHFEEAIEYKFSIAEKFQEGAKKHVMGWGLMPQWIPAKEDALAIYEEVITALPHHDLGAKALFGKAKLLLDEVDYKASIETFQTLIRRFPKSSLAPESYIGIAGIYLMQCQMQYPDPDFLDLAQINLRKFRQDFPGSERLAVAEQMMIDMKEFYANNLYEMAQFYERTKKPHAAVIYYSNLLAKYPETKRATEATKRLQIAKREVSKKEKKKEEAACVEKKPTKKEKPAQPVDQPANQEPAVQEPTQEKAEQEKEEGG